MQLLQEGWKFGRWWPATARILGRNGEMFEQILQRGPGLRG